jgi:glycosyltransferase involved in cell wall biosynthesis
MAEVPAAGSDGTPDLSVVVPVLNEIDGIDRCYQSIVAALEATDLTFEILFVDDGSTDGSTERLITFAEADGRVTTLCLAYNLGQQRAMYLALKHCRGRVVITYDSDLQFAPDCLEPLTRKVLEGHELVSGVRVARRDHPLRNHLPSMVGRLLINRALRVRQTDFGAVKAYSADLVRRILQYPLVRVVIPAAAYRLARSHTEIPVNHVERMTGASKWSVLSRMELYFDILTIFARRPFSWMLVLGTFLLMLSGLLALGIGYHILFVGADFSGLIIFFDVFIGWMGIYFLSMGIIGEFMVRAVRGGNVPLDAAITSIHRRALVTAVDGMDK